MVDSGIAGDMFSSGAPFDPSFWPVHGQIERILSLKRIRLSQVRSVEGSGFGELSIVLFCRMLLS